LGLNTYEGSVTYAPVAEAHGYKSVDLADVLS
jgi:alanine dehydrogenase